MSSLTITILIATAAVIICAIFLGIGKIITGKDKFSCKRCGKIDKDSDCSICHKDKKKPPSKK